MEYPGAIMMIEDKYLTLSNKKEMNQVFRIISHEYSHMWFGNLVTMKWWDDLWLNESFADFISYYILPCLFEKMKIDLIDTNLLFA